MDAASYSREGRAPNSIGDNGIDTMPASSVWNTALPRSGAALFEVFQDYKPLVTSTPVADSRLPKYLTWSLLQNDPNCQELSGMNMLVATIFAYSRRQHGNEMRESELAAGFRYFLPSGSLASEWIRFFDIAPTRYLDMAPPEVRYAYDRRYDWDTCSMRHSIEAGDAAWRQELSRQRTTKCDVLDTQPEVLKRKRGPELFLYQVDGEFQYPVTVVHRPSGSQHANDEQPEDFTWPMQPQENGEGAIDPTRLIASNSEDQQMHHAAEPPRAQKKRRGENGRVYGPPPALVKYSAQAVQQQAPMGQASNDQKVTRRQQSAPQQQAVHTTATSQGTRVRLAHPQTQAPHPRGSQRHQGRGFVHKGWSDDRIRAFTQIQCRPHSELPAVAHSQWGDELSRSHTPKSVDPRLCPFETTMEENLTYFTLTTSANRQMLSRAKASWTPQQMVHYVCRAHDLQDVASYDRSRLQHQFKTSKAWEDANGSPARTAIMPNLRADSTLVGADAVTHDFFLHAMGKNVVKHPEGKGKHNLTCVIEHVLLTGDMNVRLSGAATYAQRHGIVLLSKSRLLTTPVTDDGPDADIMRDTRAEYVAKFGKPA